LIGNRSIPGSNASVIEITELLTDELAKAGSQLKIKPSKVISGSYSASSSGKLRYTGLSGSSKNGVSYLGFRFDGERTYLKDATLSKLNRKFKSRIRGAVTNHIRRYKDKTDLWLSDHIDRDYLLSKFLKREKFDISKGPKNWTFWTYAVNAEKILAERALSPRIFQQLIGFQRRALPFIEGTIQDAVSKPR